MTSTAPAQPAQPATAVDPTAQALGRVQPQVKVVATDSPPLPQQVIQTVRFIPVEQDTFAQAHVWAKTEMVRKWPALATTFESLDNFMRQYLSGAAAK